jgi:hypothetical protein
MLKTVSTFNLKKRWLLCRRTRFRAKSDQAETSENQEQTGNGHHDSQIGNDDRKKEQCADDNQNHPRGLSGGLSARIFDGLFLFNGSIHKFGDRCFNSYDPHFLDQPFLEPFKSRLLFTRLTGTSLQRFLQGNGIQAIAACNTRLHIAI